MNIWYECWICHYKEQVYNKKYTTYTFRLPLERGECKRCGANNWCLVAEEKKEEEARQPSDEEEEARMDARYW